MSRVRLFQIRFREDDVVVGLFICMAKNTNNALDMLFDNYSVIEEDVVKIVMSEFDTEEEIKII